MDRTLLTSLDWSQKLRYAGFSQEKASAYWWPHYDDGLYPREGGPPHWNISWDEGGCACKNDWIGAFHAEEILRRLPMCPREGLLLTVCHGLDGSWVVAYGWPTKDAEITIQDFILANAAAAMWCYLAKNNLLPKDA